MKEVNNSHRLRAMLSLQCKTAQCTQSLKMPVATRWGSSITCLDSVLANKLSLRRLAIDEEAQVLLATATKTTILNDVFWDQVVNLLELLRPVLKWITVLEGDSPMISATVQAFVDLKDHFTATLPKSPLSKKQEKEALAILENRKDFCLKTVHFAANLLDPRFTGRNLEEEAVVDACEYICKMASRHHDVSESDILADLANYRAKGALWSKDFVRKSAEHVAPVIWWNGICSSRPLSRVAVEILSLPATSAACERSFSTYGNIHTAKRNRLGNETAMKLVYIAQNLKFCATGPGQPVEELKEVKSECDQPLDDTFDDESDDDMTDETDESMPPAESDADDE